MWSVPEVLWIFVDPTTARRSPLWVFMGTTSGNGVCEC
jgi:hypothetical protein